MFGIPQWAKDTWEEIKSGGDAVTETYNSDEFVSDEDLAKEEVAEAEERTDEQYDAIAEHIAETYPQLQEDIQTQREMYEPLKEQLQKTIDTGEGPELRKYLQQRQIGEEQMKTQIEQGARDAGVSPGDYVDRMGRALSLTSGQTTQGASDVAGFASQRARGDMLNLGQAEQASLGLESNAVAGATNAMGVGGNFALQDAAQSAENLENMRQRALMEKLAYLQAIASVAGAYAGGGGGGMGAGVGSQSSGLSPTGQQSNALQSTNPIPPAPTYRPSPITQKPYREYGTGMRGSGDIEEWRNYTIGHYGNSGWNQAPKEGDPNW